MGAARFKSDVEGRPGHGGLARLSIANGFDLRVWFARAMVPASADDLTVFDQDRSNHRIRRSGAITAAGQPESLAHIFAFTAHPKDLKTS